MQTVPTRHAGARGREKVKRHKPNQAKYKLVISRGAMKIIQKQHSWKHGLFEPRLVHSVVLS